MGMNKVLEHIEHKQIAKIYFFTDGDAVYPDNDMKSIESLVI